MNYTRTTTFVTGSIHLTIAFLLILGTFVLANGQTVRPKVSSTLVPATEPQQPLYSDYKGVKIGMTEQDVRAKLGNATKVGDSDFFVFSDSETAQIVYDAARKVFAIAVDYVGGVGAPDYKAVVGNNIDTKPDGSLYKIVYYDSLGFWVSYNRTGRNAAVTTVSITIQKIQ